MGRREKCTQLRQLHQSWEGAKVGSLVGRKYGRIRKQEDGHQPWQPVRPHSQAKRQALLPLICLSAAGVGVVVASHGCCRHCVASSTHSSVCYLHAAKTMLSLQTHSQQQSSVISFATLGALAEVVFSWEQTLAGWPALQFAYSVCFHPAPGRHEHLPVCLQPVAAQSVGAEEGAPRQAKKRNPFPDGFRRCAQYAWLASSANTVAPPI